MSNLPTQNVRFLAGEKGAEVSALLLRPEDAHSILVLAHGAGAGMRHRFLEHLSQKLAALGVATLRYQFPYMERGIKRPDSEAVLTATVRSAVAAAQKYAAGLALFAGGKSMGGRMTSLAAVKEPLGNVRGLIFFGFPLHAAGKASDGRGQHLAGVTVPMLFLQGSRDTLADLKLLKPLCLHLGKRVELYVIEGGDHSFHMLKSTRRSDDEVLDEVAQKAALGWLVLLSYEIGLQRNLQPCRAYREQTNRGAQGRRPRPGNLRPEESLSYLDRSNRCAETKSPLGPDRGLFE